VDALSSTPMVIRPPSYRQDNLSRKPLHRFFFAVSAFWAARNFRTSIPKSTVEPSFRGFSNFGNPFPPSPSLLNRAPLWTNILVVFSLTLEPPLRARPVSGHFLLSSSRRVHPPSLRPGGSGDCGTTSGCPFFPATFQEGVVFFGLCARIFGFLT